MRCPITCVRMSGNARTCWSYRAKRTRSRSSQAGMSSFLTAAADCHAGFNFSDGLFSISVSCGSAAEIRMKAASPSPRSA